MNLEARVDKLERDNKTLKKMLGGVAALAALVGGTVLGVHAENGTFDTLTAKTIHLKDVSGKTRGSLYGSNGSLLLNDTSGRARVTLEGSTGYLGLSDSSGRIRVKLTGKDGNIISSHKHTVVTHKPQARTHSYSPTVA